MTDPRWLSYMESIPRCLHADPTGRRQRQDLATVILCVPSAWLARLTVGQLRRVELVLASRRFGHPGSTVEDAAAAGALRQAQDVAALLALIRHRIAAASGNRARHGAGAGGWDLDAMPAPTLLHVAAHSVRPARRQAATAALERRLKGRRGEG